MPPAPYGGAARAGDSAVVAPGRRDGPRSRAARDTGERSDAGRATAAERVRVQRIDDAGLAPGPARNAVAAYLAVARTAVFDPAAGVIAGIDVIV